MLSQLLPEAQQHPCTQPWNPTCSHSVPVSHLTCSRTHLLIHPGIRAETFSPPAHQLTHFTSPTCLSPPSLTKAGTCPQPLATFSIPAWLTAGLFSPPPTRGLIYHLNSSLPRISEPISVHTHPSTHKGQQFISANHRVHEASLEGTSWMLAGLWWRWLLSLEWRTGSPRNEALRMKPQHLRNQQTGGLNGKTRDSKCATWRTASHTRPQKCDHLRITWSNYKPLHSWTDNAPPPVHGLSSIAAESPQQRNPDLRQTSALLQETGTHFPFWAPQATFVHCSPT